MSCWLAGKLGWGSGACRQRDSTQSKAHCTQRYAPASWCQSRSACSARQPTLHQCCRHPSAHRPFQHYQPCNRLLLGPCSDRCTTRDSPLCSTRFPAHLIHTPAACWQGFTCSSHRAGPLAACAPCFHEHPLQRCCLRSSCRRALPYCCWATHTHTSQWQCLFCKPCLQAIHWHP